MQRPNKNRSRTLRIEPLEVRRNMSFIADGFAPSMGVVDDTSVVMIGSTENKLSPLDNDGYPWMRWNSSEIDYAIPFAEPIMVDARPLNMRPVIAPPVESLASKIQSVTTPKHGIVRISDDHINVYYTPDAGFSGVDEFEYAVDGKGTEKNKATFRVNVVEPLLAIDDWFLSNPSDRSLELKVLQNDQFNAVEFNDEVA